MEWKSKNCTEVQHSETSSEPKAVNAFVKIYRIRAC